jgi:hypothetical protein
MRGSARSVPDISTLTLILLAVFSWAVILAFALMMYAGFRMQDPPLSPFQSVVTIAVVFVLAYAVLNTRSCRAFFNHPVEEVASGRIPHAST